MNTALFAGLGPVALLGGAVLFAPAPAPAPAPIQFEDIAPKSGVEFVLRNSATPERHQIETMAGGVAVFDYNNDGAPDLYFVNGAHQPKLLKDDPSFYNRLYRNNGNGTFTDVTAEAGVKGNSFETGVAAADYDNDGYQDLFVAGVDRNTLYRNLGNGKFADVTEKAGLVHVSPWTIAAGWFDYDNDGKLDLLIVNYCLWDPLTEPPCTIGSQRVYCHPKYYQPLANGLYHNNGDGTFTDVSRSSGIAPNYAKGMGVNFLDFDGDQKLDVFITSDTTPSLLFRNLGQGRFTEAGLRAGVALSEDGRALSSMGTDARDIDNDGREDLFIAAANNETFPLYRNLGKGLFIDATYSSGLGRQTMTLTGWSNGIFDFNNDGLKDLFAACGSIDDNTEKFSARTAKQRNMVLVNLGEARFTDVSAAAGQDFQQAALHRGVAFGDLDGDGRVDAVVTRIDGRAEVFRNVGPAANHWLALRLRGHRSNRDGIGAWIHVTGASGAEQWNRVTTSTGYGCSSDRVAYFGLARDAAVKTVEILWPSGARQLLENVAADRRLDIEEPEPR